jgi:nitroreductase
MDAIFKRRSVRRFSGQKVSKKAVEQVLRAAMSAPSAGNEQPWHFVVITKQSVLKELSESSPYAKPAACAPVGIVVCADAALERHHGCWVQDCSAAVENMLLEATALGLGAVWLGIYPFAERVDFLKRYFCLPENVTPFAIVPLGYPEEPPLEQERYNPLRVHYEKW